ncbi:MAG: hypothetical protein FJW37_05545 [Acidobacteria bacterium]|nr:hypothetical protein [Acidobacteriota bacterium]
MDGRFRGAARRESSPCRTRMPGRRAALSAAGRSGGSGRLRLCRRPPAAAAQHPGADHRPRGRSAGRRADRDLLPASADHRRRRAPASGAPRVARRGRAGPLRHRTLGGSSEGVR